MPTPRKHLVPAVLLGLLCALSAPRLLAQESGSRTITVSGVVRDAQTGAAIRGVVVAVPAAGIHAETDAEGAFTLRGLRAGVQKWVVSRLGYAGWEQEVEATEDGAVFTVGLLPRPEILEGITVVADRFEIRRKRTALSVRAVERSAILTSAAASALDVLSTRAGLHVTTCADGSLCAMVRGRSVRPSIWVDDIREPAGMEVLGAYAPHDLYLVESYEGGRRIRVYTTWYVERLAKLGYKPPPLVWW